MLLHTFGQARRVATSRCWVVSTHLQSPKYGIIFVRPVLSGHTKQIEQSFKVENIFEAPKTPGARSTPQAIVADGVGIQVFFSQAKCW